MKLLRFMKHKTQFHGLKNGSTPATILNHPEPCMSIPTVNSFKCLLSGAGVCETTPIFNYILIKTHLTWVYSIFANLIVRIIQFWDGGLTCVCDGRRSTTRPHSFPCDSHMDLQWLKLAAGTSVPRHYFARLQSAFFTRVLLTTCFPLRGFGH